MREKVVPAQKIQTERFKKDKKVFCNAHMESSHTRKHCKLDASSRQLIKNAIEQLGLYAIAYDRILKVSPTIADLDGSENIQSNHIAEAVQYRSLDRKLWMGL